MTWCIIGTILGGSVWAMFYFTIRRNILPILWRHSACGRAECPFHGGLLGVCLAIILLCKRRGWALLPVCECCRRVRTVWPVSGAIGEFRKCRALGATDPLPLGGLFSPAHRRQSCGQRLGEYCARHPSQLYEAALEGVVLFGIITVLIFYRGLFKTPGMAMAVFGFGYGVSRVIVEAFRQGDAQFVGANNPWGHIIRLGSTADSIGMTMGQILSLPLIFGGLLLMYALQRRR